MDGVQYSTSPASDVAGSPAAESDEMASNSTKTEAKGSRMQTNPHIEVNHVSNYIWEIWNSRITIYTLKSIMLILKNHIFNYLIVLKNTPKVF